MGGSKFVVVLAAVVVMMGVKQSVRLPNKLIRYPAQ